MVFHVSVPHERHTTPDQLDELARRSRRLVTKDGRRGGYRPVRIGETLVTTVSARNETQARRMVADVVGRDPDELVASPRGPVRPSPAASRTDA